MLRQWVGRGAAERLFHARVQHRAVVQCQADRTAKVIALRKLAVVIRGHFNARQQGLHTRVGMGLVFKVRQADMTV